MRSALVCVLALAMSVPASARADEAVGADRDSTHADKFVTIVASTESPLLERLAQEMRLAGLSVARSTDPPEVRSKLVVVVPDDADAPIEIWTVSNGTSKLAVLVPSGGPDDTRALRVAELARALVVSPSALPDPSPAAVLAPAVAPAAAVVPPNPPPHRTSPTLDAVVVDPKPAARAREAPPFDFGTAVGIGFQSAGISMQIEATATYWPHDLVGVGFFGSAPVIPATIEEPSGTADVRAALFAAELATAPIGRKEERFALLLNPGLAFGYLHVSGTGLASEDDRIGDKPLVATYGRAEFRVRIAGPVSLKASGLAGAAFPPVDIRFQAFTVSTFCPLGSASLGIVVEP